ncbi:MAG: hypothetical protein CSB13_10650 [Chloroflexi bacterium]|nr:MAG: hypothetical protein CSB13_10650 [Chloroflexota bacterium]
MTDISDKENPEWQETDSKKARPAAEQLPHLGEEKRKQKKPKKIPISIRLSPEVVTFFRAQGKGWQTKLNQILQEYVAAHED